MYEIIQFEIDCVCLQIVSASSVGVGVPLTSQTPSANTEFHNRVVSARRRSARLSMSAGKQSARRDSLRTSMLKSAVKKNTGGTVRDNGVNMS